jgi:hypothetical protein
MDGTGVDMMVWPCAARKTGTAAAERAGQIPYLGMRN